MKYNILTDSFTTYDNVELPKIDRTPSIDTTIFDDSFYNWISNVSSTNSSNNSSNNSSQLNINNTQETSAKNNNRSNYEATTTSKSSNDSISDDISFEELIKQEKLPVKITSSFRKSAGNHGRRDSKGNSMAYDIIPLNGDFEDLFNKIYTNPRIVNWLKNRNWGILEEITPDVMHRTKATGKHLHIGPDSWAIQMFNARLKKYG